MLMRVIGTSAHAALDYIVGILLIAAPWLFGFADESTAATWISILAGVALIGMSMITDYEGGVLARVIGMREHLIADLVLGVFLIASPWLFGFADEGTNAWLPFVLIGAGEVGAAAMTDPTPDRSTRRRPARSAA